MKKFGAFVLLVFGLTTLALAADVTGWVTDSACATKGKAGADHKACAEKCAAKGMELVLVTDDKKVIKIHNKDAVSKVIGDKVTATGKLDGDSIHIDAVKPAM